MNKDAVGQHCKTNVSSTFRSPPPPSFPISKLRRDSRRRPVSNPSPFSQHKIFSYPPNISLTPGLCVRPITYIAAHVIMFVLCLAALPSPRSSHHQSSFEKEEMRKKKKKMETSCREEGKKRSSRIALRSREKCSRIDLKCTKRHFLIGIFSSVGFRGIGDDAALPRMVVSLCCRQVMVSRFIEKRQSPCNESNRNIRRG